MLNQRDDDVLYAKRRSPTSATTSAREDEDEDSEVSESRCFAYKKRCSRRLSSSDLLVYVVAFFSCLLVMFLDEFQANFLRENLNVKLEFE